MGIGKAFCDGLLEQGEVILVRFQFTDPQDYKIRPAIVVSNNSFNRKFHPFVCPITSKSHSENFQINDKLIEGSFGRESFVRTNVIATIHPELILKTIGKAEKEAILELKEKLVKNL
ncbi:MAG: type II toxin-antitoxin system PemK/MazF family toxin [archaeon]